MSDTDKLITLERLRDILAAYGARPGLWPPSERAAAQALIETSDEARALYAEEQALDSLLQQVAEPEVSAALQGRVRSITLPSGPTPSATLLSQLADWLRPQSQMAWQGAVVASGILGIVVGVGLSAMVMDAGAPPATIVAANEDRTSMDTARVDTGTVPESSNFIFSLTGETIAETETTVEDSDNGEGTFTVAGIPLY